MIEWPRDGASPSRCKKCRAEVWWAQKPGGGWHRPLARTRIETITVTEGVAHLADIPVYRMHRCDPRVLDEASRDRARYFPGSGHLLTEVAVPCSRCGAEVGETCRTLSDSHRQKYGDQAKCSRQNGRASIRHLDIPTSDPGRVGPKSPSQPHVGSHTHDERLTHVREGPFLRL